MVVADQGRALGRLRQMKQRLHQKRSIQICLLIVEQLTDAEVRRGLPCAQSRVLLHWWGRVDFVRDGRGVRRREGHRVAMPMH